MQQIFYAAVVLLLVVVVMSLPIRVLMPVIIIGVIFYFYYDIKKQSLNKKLVRLFRQIAENSNDEELKIKFSAIADLRSRDKFIETVFVGSERDRLLTDAIKNDLPSGFSDQDLVDYLTSNAYKLAYGETYEELEISILQIKDIFNNK